MKYFSNESLIDLTVGPFTGSIKFNLPMMEAPWSRAWPVNDCTRCSSDSRVLAGLVGALVVRELCLDRLSERSPALGGPVPPLLGTGGGAEGAVEGAATGACW